MFGPKEKISATVVSNTLVVTSGTPKDPRVARIDMGQFVSSALEIQDIGGTFALLIRPGQGAPEQLGVFSDRKKAAEALQAVTAAFMQGVHPHKTGGVVKKLFKFLLFLILMLAVLIVFVKPRQPMHIGGSMDAAPAAVETAPQAPVPEGVPVPADQAIGAP